MKVLVIIALFIAVVAANPPKEIIAEAMGKCTETTGASLEIIEKIRNHDLSFDDPKGWCFEKCLCSTIGLCDDKFKLVADKFKKHEKIPSAKVDEMVPKCNEITSENDCETVHMRFKCIFEKVPEIREHKALAPAEA